MLKAMPKKPMLIIKNAPESESLTSVRVKNEIRRRNSNG